MRIQHGAILRIRCEKIRTGRKDRRRSGHVIEDAGLRYAGAQRRSRRISAAGRDRRAGPQAAGFRGGLCQPAHNIVRRKDAAQSFSVHTERLQQLLIP